MKNLLKLSCLLVVVVGISAAAMATTCTTSSCDVNFAVNDGGSFYVESSQIPSGAGSPPGLNASSSISGSDFHLTAGGAGYSDAGIVLYFNGGLKLGALQSVSVVSTGSPVSINLWLDTGGDGNFFAFNSNAQMTALNGDSYGSHGGASLDANSSISMMGGNGAGQTYTLAQLQAGVVAGINSNTRASLWIGITNNGSADISGIAVQGPLSITTVSLPSGTVLGAYSQTLTATGGALPYNWSVSAGSLPNGLNLNSATGEISGAPITSGTFNFTAQVTDAALSSAVKNLSISTEALPVRYGDPGAPVNYDQIIQSAYDHCADAYVIEVQALEFPSDLICDRNVSVTLKGGFDQGFNSNPSYTTIQGRLVISNGTVIVENIVIR